MVSRLDKRENYKGHREMIAAWRRIADRNRDAELWIVGDGDLRPALERQAREYRLGEVVRFFGSVENAERDRLITASRCLALPSRGEGFGLVYLEAMRLGRPCLVSTLDAGREVVDPPLGGLAVDPTDQTAIVEAICRLLTPGPDWETSSLNARCRYEARFTGPHFQERLRGALDCLRSGQG
jgi:phosphatidylinositol alpha-1,6-mannosyltransferase